MSQYNINLSSTNDKLTTAEIDGDLTIDNSLDIYNFFINKLLLDDELDIVFNTPVSLDLSFIQLLISFLKSRNKKKLSTSIKWNIDETNYDLLHKTGVIESIDQLQKQE